jgi:hypothetical protein
VLSLAVLAFRGDLTKDAELLVLRHENAVLRSTLAEYQAHYNTARPHQGIAHESPMAKTTAAPSPSPISTGRDPPETVLGGLINECSRTA